ncbi:hypothetical protein A4X06_0g372 [Tilletia controversa]|uniref:SUZ domain-containing protein n=4 Tax=Tilletia TaxID=13289 RepID=A0A8X7MZG8_9BASI|nr:hypothetical protein A4X06_0g372 [Tilletia controversa]KAE8265562.1 hypothetical protein A4X03_0g187 [Tilletia caries]
MRLSLLDILTHLKSNEPGMASTSYASAVARRLATVPPSTSKTTALDHWEDDNSDGKGIVSSKEAEAGAGATRGIQEQRAAAEIEDEWGSGAGARTPSAERAVTVEEWNRANSSAPKIMLARRTAGPEGSPDAWHGSANPYAELVSSSGTGTSTVQHAILHPTTPRILQRPAKSAGGAGGGSRSPAPVSTEERAQALREREERYRLARERIFGAGSSTSTVARGNGQ